MTSILYNNRLIIILFLLLCSCSHSVYQKREDFDNRYILFDVKNEKTEEKFQAITTAHWIYKYLNNYKELKKLIKSIQKQNNITLSVNDEVYNQLLDHKVDCSDTITLSSARKHLNSQNALSPNGNTCILKTFLLNDLILTNNCETGWVIVQTKKSYHQKGDEYK